MMHTVTGVAHRRAEAAYYRWGTALLSHVAYLRNGAEGASEAIVIDDLVFQVAEHSSQHLVRQAQERHPVWVLALSMTCGGAAPLQAWSHDTCTRIPSLMKIGAGKRACALAWAQLSANVL
jgi:hypothetical protein